MADLDTDGARVLCEAAYRAALVRAGAPGFTVPKEIVQAWGKPDDFTAGYLRSFLTFCWRTEISQWVERIGHCLERKRDPWAENADASTKLRKALEDWLKSDWIQKQWTDAQSNASQEGELPPALLEQERKRIAREQMELSIRPVLRDKRGGGRR